MFNDNVRYMVNVDQSFHIIILYVARNREENWMVVN